MEWLRIFFRGMMMGAADIVPGVSGGTIAFITGIYERLISAINGFLPALLRLLSTKSLHGFIKDSDFVFLMILFAGILTSIFAFANLISHLIFTYPILVWSFFFGLIVASVWIVRQDVSRWSVQSVIAVCGGIAFAYFLANATFLALPLNLWGVFLSGFIAICAMILPGISGSFILLLLGTYTYIIGAIRDFDFVTLLVFALGCGFGLLLSARIIHAALVKYRDITIGFLIGLMIGALDKIWPWKQTVSVRINSKGETVPLEQISITPNNYTELTGLPSEFGFAVIYGVGGALFLLTLDRIIKKHA